ncbi:MAG: hypothetical protein HC888_14230 [Candidatus Competibacteraceae bacterium]|nr:hypothetical protein [Candidatus Competibacteraceae bacterium]
MEFDLAEATPTPRLVTNDEVTKSDAFAFVFDGQQVMLSGNDALDGATQVYTRNAGAQYFEPVDVITPQIATLERPSSRSPTSTFCSTGVRTRPFRSTAATTSFSAQRFSSRAKSGWRRFCTRPGSSGGYPRTTTGRSLNRSLRRQRPGLGVLQFDAEGVGASNGNDRTSQGGDTDPPHPSDTEFVGRAMTRAKTAGARALIGD